ncbi:MAG TPA: DUF1203 domain-containing protein [Chthoniobacterales bacterium]|jgi:hypothetical protein|nr:DUF1203 domain-containing protein [Chthoniobacterales bacterium]
MIAIRVVAIPTEVCVQVRTLNKSPRYGHPAHTEVAEGYGPCRHCLRAFHIGEESRTLFTYDPFDGIEQVPLPGPIFIHTEACERYPETAGYPDDLRKHAAVLDAYAKGQHLVARRHAEAGRHEAAVEELLQLPDVDYIEVRDRVAGCYDFRIERLNGAGEQAL